MVKYHFKNSSIRIRIFIKIQSILPCHTPNLSIKFRPNPSTTYWDTVLYIVFGTFSQWWRITLKIQQVRSGSRSSPKSNQFTLVTHPTCPQNFIQIRPQLFEISCKKSNRKTKKGEGQLGECIPPPCKAWSRKTYLAQYIFEISCHMSFLSPISQWWRITSKIIVVGCGPKLSLKSKQFVPDTHPFCPPSFIRVRQHLFDISCWNV